MLNRGRRRDRSRPCRNAGRADGISASVRRLLGVGLTVGRHRQAGYVEDRAGPVNRAADALLVDRLAASLHFGQGLEAERAVDRVTEVPVVELTLPAVLAEADLARVRLWPHLLSGNVLDAVQVAGAQAVQLVVAFRGEGTARVRLLRGTNSRKFTSLWDLIEFAVT